MILSVITINLNDADGLEKTINSIIGQDTSLYEHIVIDGGSTDGSVEIIKKNIKNIKYWVSEKDKGIYNAVNKGILQSSGEYCCFLNSGDVFHNNQVISMINSIELHSDIIAFNCIVDQSLSEVIVRPPKSIRFYDFYLHTIIHQATLIKSDLFSTVGNYNEDLKIVSDWEFLVRALFLHHSSYQSNSGTLSVFDTSGISSNPEFSSICREERLLILNRYFPRFLDDYSLFFNKAVYTFLDKMKNKKSRKVLISITRVMNKLFK